MRKRTNSSPGFDYQVERHNSAWPDHIARTNVTAALITWLRPNSIIDPACGDGSIVLLADRIWNIHKVVLSDISRPNYVYLKNYGVPHIEVECVPILEALRARLDVPLGFDVVVLTEILEHMDDPVAVLKAARDRASYLVASSPEMRPGQDDHNPEHLWQFDGDGYFEMLREGGWNPFHKTHMGFPGLEYDFQVWVCR